MLKSLQIRNYVLIDSLEVSFPEGLIIISGQTGAGKSILLGALSLLLGEKADASTISENADSCVVEAVFEIPLTDSSVMTLLESNDLDTEDGEVIVRRVVGRNGRSRSFINDSPVALSVLKSITSSLVDIHSQHQTLLLSDKDFQLSMLDHFAGNETLLSDCAKVWKELKDYQKEYARTCEKLERLNEERDYSLSRFQRLEDARLAEGELEELETEQKQLANAGEIKQAFGTVEDVFYPSDPSSASVSLSSALKEVQRQLEKAGRFVPEAIGLAERISAARLELEDICEEVSELNSHTELSQDRLVIVEERLSLLYGLLKSYSAADITELIARRDELSESLFDADALESRKEELLKKVDALKSSYEGICSALHESRLAAAIPFAEAIKDSVRSLELEHAVFGVVLEEGPETVSGRDIARFMFSASGSGMTDVAKCASGGELSRLMLCLKAMMARFVNMPTLIFDEIDSGVSGSVADKMGRMICSMGEDMQVFSITHLPQVAAKGDAHYLVEKEYDVLGTRAVSSLRRITGEERVKEIARMLSGSKITDAAIQNARELLLSV